MKKAPDATAGRCPLLGMRPGKWLLAAGGLFLCAGLLLALATYRALLPLPDRLPGGASSGGALTDRHGTPLRTTYQTQWNEDAPIELNAVPVLLKNAVLLAEDRRFLSHNGMDWMARIHALVANVKALRPVRGASTITEQVVRMLHPRPRTVWSRWIEGFEAATLEKRFTKSQILTFYLNQVPYAAHRRGVVQAARHYFDREVDTLSPIETLTLAALIRAPGRMDLYKDPERVRPAVLRLAERMEKAGLIASKTRQHLTRAPLCPQKGTPLVEAAHFVRYLVETHPKRVHPAPRPASTTLDGSLQAAVSDILNAQLLRLSSLGIENGAVIVVDHGNRNQVLAWVNDAGPHEAPSDRWIDAARVPRQPGSTLKPFLYALSMERGWTAATLIEDSPMSEPVGSGLHTFRNYSRIHYGPVTLRKALGNSLNIPAVRALQFVTADTFLSRLRRMGIASLSAHPDHYGAGLALGNGEVPLESLVEAYTVLARDGLHAPLTFFLDQTREPEILKRVFPRGVCRIIGHILSDPEARKPEFSGDLLTFANPTAVKTGTSSDFRDSWAVGYDRIHTVGVWMGNLTGRPTSGVNGSRGAALVLRSVFSELGKRFQKPHGFEPMPTEVRQSRICLETGTAFDGSCPSRDEWFLSGTGPNVRSDKVPSPMETVAVVYPTPGLLMALDPRIPDPLEYARFSLNRALEHATVTWVVDGIVAGQTSGPAFDWPVTVGSHQVEALLKDTEGRLLSRTSPVRFFVK